MLTFLISPLLGAIQNWKVIDVTQVLPIHQPGKGSGTLSYYPGSRPLSPSGYLGSSDLFYQPHILWIRPGGDSFQFFS